MKRTQRRDMLASQLVRVVVVTVLTGCGDRVEVEPQHLQQFDSAGLVVADVPPPASMVASSIPVERVARLDHEFGVVSAAALLEGGRLAVADALSDEVLLFDERGRFERVLGGRGEGPGEFQEPTTLQYRDGRLMVYDRFLRRVTHFQEERVVNTEGLGPGSRLFDLRPLVQLAEGSYLVTHGEDRRGFRSSTEPIWRDSIPLMIMRSKDGTADTLGLWAGTEKAFQEHPSGIARLTVGFGSEGLAAASGSFIAIGSSDPLDIMVFELGEEKLRLISRSERRLPTSDDLSELREWRQRNVPIDQQWFKELWMDAPIRETVPIFGAIAVSASGEVWLGGFAKPGERNRTWIVVDLAGRALGRVDLPSEWSILDVRGDRMVVHWEGDYDEDYLEIRSFELPGVVSPR